MQGDPPQPLEDAPEAIAARHRRTWRSLAVVVAILAALLVAYNFVSRPDPLPGTGEKMSLRQVWRVAKPLIGRLQSFNISGQPQFAGLAVTIAEGQMVTTCHSVPGSGPLEVTFHDGKSRVESARMNRSIDVCVLNVKTTGPDAAKLREGDPANGEKIFVVYMKDANATPKLIEAHVTNLISEVSGVAFGIDTKEELATGAAVFDTQGRLAGIVTVPHSYGDLTAALSSTRIAKARLTALK